MTKKLVLLGVYVEDAVATARDYEVRLSMRRVAEHRVRTEHGHSDGLVLARSPEPPWVAIFSGRGKESRAARMLSEHSAGLHQLVYFTDTYDQDRAWLGKRGLGFEQRFALRGGQSVRQVSAALPELGMIIDLVESPPAPCDDQDWLEPLLRALLPQAEPCPSDARSLERDDMRTEVHP